MLGANITGIIKEVMLMWMLRQHFMFLFQRIAVEDLYNSKRCCKGGLKVMIFRLTS